MAPCEVCLVLLISQLMAVAEKSKYRRIKGFHDEFHEFIKKPTVCRNQC